ncbi:MazG nucleotide pyrophosphohydrolase domain-containing protein [Microlunatus speluncae]|uniref:MazG nucleotide pyrophosphohydrolase domain-containing protein n=1 Tax=Microlunatus speluncae TaxID=2594267 RepID=UPI00126675DC|nr:MazG nucleotide pyrophosphohydrolase domain-containing protein [Microlunatus speluncae]
MELRELSDQVEIRSESYGRHFGVERTPEWMMLKLNEEVGELTRAFLIRTGQSRDHGFNVEDADDILGEEMADVFAHVLLLARHHGVDLEAEVKKKWL